MAAIQIGTAVVWGAPALSSLKTGSTQSNATVASARALIVTGISVTPSRQMEETADADGDIVAAVLYGHTTECTVECFPADSTIANGKTANALPAIGDVLKFTTASATEEADIAATSETGSYVGFWCIVGASKNRTNTAKTTWTLTLKRWGGISDVSQL